MNFGVKTNYRVLSYASVPNGQSNDLAPIRFKVSTG